MTGLIAQATVKGPPIDWEALSPFIALTAGACVVLLVGLARSALRPPQRRPGPDAGHARRDRRARASGSGTSTRRSSPRRWSVDNLTLTLTMIFVAGGIAAVFLAWRSVAAAEAGEGEYYALLLTSILGMVVLVAANDLVVLFIGFELLSIPLYVLCATHMKREQSLESGLKYLIIGSVGSATLLYGLAMLYGAAGGTNYEAIAAAGAEMADDVLFLTGVALVMAGLAFKASIAPFHQWTPDVYEGAPTPVTAFMAVATKAAAFGVLLRLFDVALISAATTWAPAFATLAVITIVVGNVGAIGQSSLKRMLAYSSVAQAGYMLAGVVVSTQLGISAVIFYLAIYVVMNLAAFAVITARERETGLGDDISIAVRARRRPAVAGLADDDRDAGPGRLPRDRRLLRQALPDQRRRGQRLRVARHRDRARVGDLAGLLPAGRRRGLDALALRGARAARARSPGDRRRVRGGRRGGPRRRPRARCRAPTITESDFETSDPVRRTLRQPEVVFVAVACALVTIVFGVYPEPLFNVAQDAGSAIQSLI